MQSWTLWSPVAFGAGAALYLALPGEPLPLVAYGLLAVAAALVWTVRRLGLSRPAAVLLLLAAFASAGFAAAKLRTQAVRAPIAPPGGGVRMIEGYVIDIASPGQGGPRILLAPIRISGLSPSATPIRVRVTLRGDQALPSPGEAVALKGMVNAPPPPASPGSYDFARDAFFDGVGGVGFALSPLEPLKAEQAPPWRLRLEMRINAVRWALARRIVGQMGAESGGLAAAMVTGHEAFVPRQQVEDLRASGLAHIISISGLHMAIVGGFVFAAARLLIAAWPWAALRVSSKKVAAAAGLAAVGAYLVLSGAPSPAERAAITAGTAFLAILVDRRAISLHTLAVAALAILALQPEAVTQPGFQMSFAATAALVALAEAWPRPAREINTPLPIRAAQAVGVWIGASIGASFVAGLDLAGGLPRGAVALPVARAAALGRPAAGPGGVAMPTPAGARRLDRRRRVERSGEAGRGGCPAAAGRQAVRRRALGAPPRPLAGPRGGARGGLRLRPLVLRAAAKRGGAAYRRDLHAAGLDHREEGAAVLRLGRGRGHPRRGRALSAQPDLDAGRLRPRRLGRTLPDGRGLEDRLGPGPSRPAPLDAQW